MNKKEKAIVRAFPMALDEAVKTKFGVECETKFDFFGDMKYKTYFGGKGQQKKEIRAFIEGYTAGNLELRNRLEFY